MCHTLLCTAKLLKNNYSPPLGNRIFFIVAQVTSLALFLQLRVVVPTLESNHLHFFMYLCDFCMWFLLSLTKSYSALSVTFSVNAFTTLPPCPFLWLLFLLFPAVKKGIWKDNLDIAGHAGYVFWFCPPIPSGQEGLTILCVQGQESNSSYSFYSFLPIARAGLLSD